MEKKRYWKSFVGVAATLSVFLLAACGNDGGNDTADADNGNDNGNVVETEETTDGLFSPDDFSAVKTNMGEAIEGGTLNFGLVSDTPFAGVLHPVFSTGAPDTQVQQFFFEGMLTVDEDGLFTQDGAATFEISEDGHVITFTINDNVYWHDGYPVTARDWAFAFEVISHPDYAEVGVRFGPTFTNIVGVTEFNKGEVDYISGINILDERVLEIEFIEVLPSTLNGGIWSSPLAYHIFGEMDIVDMPSSDEVRRNPIGFGPFIVDHIVPGESVTYVRNENYWRGTPTLDGVTLRVISFDMVAQELRSGGVDAVSTFPVGQFPENYEMPNIEWLGRVSNAYSYVAFKLGYWCNETNQNVTVPGMKMSDVNLRRAMWHAIDNETVGERFFHGLRWDAATLIPPVHPTFHNEELERPEFSKEIANQLLDDAGFNWDAAGEWRTDQDGNPLEINLLTFTGDATAEAVTAFYVQSWHDIGLNVVLNTVEFNTWVDMVADDHPDIDMFMGAWSVGTNADPYGLYGRTAQFNRTRFVSENNDRLLALGNSAEAVDMEFRQEIYNEWQAYMIEQVPIFPTHFRLDVIPVNNRVLNFERGWTTIGSIDNPLYRVALSSETAY